MNNAVTLPDSEEWPDYARIWPQQGSFLRHWFSDIALRLTTKRIRDGSNYRALRQQAAVIDRLIADIDPRIGISEFDCDHVTCEWLDLPESRDSRVILYFHGGGFFCGLPLAQGAMAVRWSRMLDARVLRPAYRLAPEHPFPAAPDDCFAVYEWLIESGHDPAGIVLAGDSAGGTLTLLTLQRARRAGLPMPACAVLLSPATDVAAVSHSLVDNAELDPMFSLAGMLWMRDMYLPDLSLAADARVSPLHGSFEGLPPLLFQAGSTEMLLDDSLRAAAKAYEQGVDVEVEVFQELPHVFQIDHKLAATRQADALIVDFISRHAGWRRTAGGVVSV